MHRAGGGEIVMSTWQDIIATTILKSVCESLFTCSCQPPIQDDGNYDFPHFQQIHFDYTAALTYLAYPGMCCSSSALVFLDLWDLSN